MPPLTAAQSRALDRFAMDALGIPGVVLMENAGRNAAHLLLQLGARGPVAVCCGKGNNGGDGFVVARHLAVAGVPALTVLFADAATLTGDAAVNYAILTKCGLPVETMPDESRLSAILAGADWVVDALLGSGLKGQVKAPFDRAIAAINACGKPVLAIDVPSGLDADTGLPLGTAVRATHTATVAANKAGFALDHARPYVGEVRVIDMGLPPGLISAAPAASAP
jgi:NAD(P)H-hydrate epimerase